MKKTFAIVTLSVVVLFFVVGCVTPTPYVPLPTWTPEPTSTQFPAYSPIPTSTPRPIETEILSVGDKITLQTDGSGIIVIEVLKLSDGFGNPTPSAPSEFDPSDPRWNWYVDVQSNISANTRLRCTFNDWDCLGNLNAEGEVWPNEKQPTGLEGIGLQLVGTHEGVQVEFDSRWEIVQ